MERIAAWITEVLESPGDEVLRARVQSEVREMAGAFPVPGLADLDAL
jgi:hypothetical protein